MKQGKKQTTSKKKKATRAKKPKQACVGLSHKESIDLVAKDNHEWRLNPDIELSEFKEKYGYTCDETTISRKLGNSKYNPELDGVVCLSRGEGSAAKETRNVS